MLWTILMEHKWNVVMFTMWLHFNDWMLTSDTLANWEMIVDTTCSLWKHQFERMNNLFAKYEFTIGMFGKPPL